MSKKEKYDWEKEFIKYIPKYKRYLNTVIFNKNHINDVALTVDDYISDAFLQIKKSKLKPDANFDMEKYGLRAIKWSYIGAYNRTKNRRSMFLDKHDNVKLVNNDSNYDDYMSNRMSDNNEHVINLDNKLHLENLETVLNRNPDKTLPVILKMMTEGYLNNEIAKALKVDDWVISKKKSHVIKPILCLKRKKEIVKREVEVKIKERIRLKDISSISLSINYNKYHKNLSKYREISEMYERGSDIHEIAKIYNIHRVMVYYALKKWKKYKQGHQFKFLK